MVVVVSVVIASFAAPVLTDVARNFRFRAGVTNVVGGISATRYQALMRGTATALQIDPARGSYQAFQRDAGGNWIPMGGEIPLGDLRLAQPVRLEFQPNGRVVAAQGTLNLSAESKYGTEYGYHTITVSSFGSVRVQ